MGDGEKGEVQVPPVGGRAKEHSGSQGKPLRPSACWKCGTTDIGDVAGLCWRCFRLEQED